MTGSSKTEPDPVAEDWRERAVVEAAAKWLCRRSCWSWSDLPGDDPVVYRNGFRDEARDLLTAIESDLGPLAPISETKRLIVERLRPQAAHEQPVPLGQVIDFIESLPLEDLGGRGG